MNFIPWIGILLCIAGLAMIHISTKYVIKLSGLLLLYLGGGVMLLTSCSFQICLSLVICGIGSSVLLGTGKPGQPDPADFSENKIKRYFRGLLCLIFGLLAYALTERLRFWIPVRRTLLFVSLWISMLGVIGLTLDDHMADRCIYIQCICLAFTVSYVYMESSTLVFGCFAAINLMMAFGSSVLSSGMSSRQLTEEKENS